MCVWSDCADIICLCAHVRVSACVLVLVSVLVCVKEYIYVCA